MELAESPWGGWSPETAAVVRRLGVSFEQASEAFEAFRPRIQALGDSIRWLETRAAWERDAVTAARQLWARSTDPDPLKATCSILSAALRPPELRQPSSWVIPHLKVGQSLRDAQALAGEIERAQQHPSLRALLGERVWGPEYGAWR